MIVLKLKVDSWLLFFLLVLVNVCLSQDTSFYLTNNHFSISVVNENSRFPNYYYEDIQKHEVFTFGEAHFSKGNCELYKSIFPSLNKEGVTYIVFEISFGLNQLFENCFEKNDLNAYYKIKQLFKNDSDFLCFFEWLYLYNLNLPANNKIKVVCVDIEDFYDITLIEMKSLIPNIPPPNEIAKTLNKIKKFETAPKNIKKNKYSHKRLNKKHSKNLNKDIFKNDSIYRFYFKDSYNKFKILSQGYYISNYYYSLKILNFIGFVRKNMLQLREDFMYNNYIFLKENNSQGKIFSIHGKYHLNVGLSGEHSVIEMLNSKPDSPFKNKVCSFIIDYTSDSFGNSLDNKNLQQFLKCSTTPLTMFKLDGEGTPFKEMSEKFQYIIINKY